MCLCVSEASILGEQLLCWNFQSTASHSCSYAVRDSVLSFKWSKQKAAQRKTDISLISLCNNRRRNKENISFVTQEKSNM